MEIRISGMTVNTSAVLGNIDAYAESLSRARSIHGHALCLCSSPSRKLVIRAVRERLFLAVWPHDGHNHHYACPFHRDEEDSSGRAHAVMPAVKETDEGFEIATDFQLERRPAVLDGLDRSAAAYAPDASNLGSRPTRTRMGLLGVLHHLWKESNLNTWGGNWRRDWWRVTQALLPVIEQGKLGRHPMTECLYLVPELNSTRRKLIDAAWSSFKGGLVSDGSSTKVGVVLGEAMAMEKSKFGYRLTLRHFAPFLYFSDELRNKLATSYAKGYHRIGSRDGQRVVAICLVELTVNGNLTVTDAALMATSKFFIPVDSSYEAALADLLVSEKRSFIKPLSVRSGESTLPDFILTDCKPEYVLEVFGMNTVDYIARKIAKKEVYKSQGKPVWCWEPEICNKPPALPRPSPVAAKPFNPLQGDVSTSEQNSSRNLEGSAG